MTMAKPWENHGKTLGKPWENGDKLVISPRKMGIKWGWIFPEINQPFWATPMAVETPYQWIGLRENRHRKPRF